MSLVFPALAGRFFTNCATWQAFPFDQTPCNLSQEIYYGGGFTWKPDLENFNSGGSDLSTLFKNE